MNNFTHPAKVKITRRKRIEVALTLSPAILKFYKISWIDSGGRGKTSTSSKATIPKYFSRADFTPCKASLVSKSNINPFLPTLLPLFWEIFGEPILTRLGLALVELALGRRLRELRVQDKDEFQGGD